MRTVSLVFLILALALPGAAFAQGPGSYIQRAGSYGGPLVLRAYYVAGDTCQAALSGRRGAPPGQTVGPDTIPVTITIGPNPRGCGDSRLVQRVMTIGGPKAIFIVQIFFVDTSGRILKIERVIS